MFDLWIKIHSTFQSEQLKEVYETLQSKICENYYWSLWMAATYANQIIRMLTSSDIKQHSKLKKNCVIKMI